LIMQTKRKQLSFMTLPMKHTFLKRMCHTAFMSVTAQKPVRLR
jgi:hypothetical protein